MEPEEQELDPVRLRQALALEIGAGAAWDIATTWMNLVPLVGQAAYTGLNFLQGAGTNLVAQYWRGEDEIAWGEVLASGGVSLIPGLGGSVAATKTGAKAIQSTVGGRLATTALRSGAQGVAHEGIRLGIDEQRLPTIQETGTAAALGGVIGGGLQGTSELGGALIKQINKGSDALQVAFTGGLDVGTARDTSGNVPLSQRMGDAYARNKKIIKEGKSLETGTQLDFTDVTPANKKTLKKMGLWDYKSVFSMDELDGIITRTQAKGIVTPDIPGFTKAQAERLGKIDELKSFYKNLTIDQIIPELDHKTPLKLSAYLMNKTTGAKRVAIRKTILDEGIYLAEMKENMQALPREVHAIWTRNMNKYLGKTHKNFQDTFLAEMAALGITDELDIAREFARRIKAARETFDVAFDAHKITYGSEWTNNIDDMVNKLDEAFEAGDEWAPRRTNEAVSEINESLSNLDEVPFNKEAAQDLIRRFNLDNVDVHTLKELFDKPMSEQVKFLRKHTGKTIGELNDQLSQWNMSIADLLNLLDE